ncbi:MAG: dUTP diphosphatase [Oscillospiraceae bacterium]
MRHSVPQAASPPQGKPKASLDCAAHGKPQTIKIKCDLSFKWQGSHFLKEEIAITLNIKRLRLNAKLPYRATADSVGYDLFACIDENVVIPAKGRVKIPCGIAVEVPQGFGAFLFARSSLGTKFGVVPANCVGVVDSDYRGEIIVPLANHSDTDYIVSPNDRIAQMVIIPVLCPEISEVTELNKTERGDGGFGSTGKGE